MPLKPVILLVDDLEENLVALEAVLERDDVVLLKASSGRAALEALLVTDVALALVDVQMPGMDGFELAELMRGTERTREVPLIFVTAGMQDHARIFRGYESGAVDFLYKPLDPYVLRSKVDVFLRLHYQKQLLSDQVVELQSAEQRLREADRRKDEFLALLSHELRNPLTPIRNSLYILRRATPGSEPAVRAMEVIERQTDHLAHLVNDLLDVTRIMRGKVRLHLERVDAVEVLQRTVEDHRASFAASEIGLSVSTPARPVWIDADAIRLAQAVGNLLVNALKFTPRGGLVEAAVEQEASSALIRIQDNGAGIAPDVLEHIFQPFIQADHTLARSQGGLGLGLALVKGMAEMHGGSISASSNGPGRGSCFCLRLPLAADGKIPFRTSASDPSPRRRRVLLIEDNEDSAMSLREVLEMLGHEVHVSATGSEGIALARQVSPEVVVCDIGLPGMDGYAVARELRSLRPAPVLIALTGYALPEDLQRAADAGFGHHIAKPVKIEQLNRLLALP